MQMLTRPLTLAAALAVLLASPAAARAQTEQTFFSFTSEAGDYIGAGQQRFFTTDSASFQSQASQGNNQFSLTLFPFEGGFWHMTLSAPLGQSLAPGVYEGAARWPFQSPGQPGLDVSGDGRGCNTLTGRFEVIEAVYGPAGYVERFHATFEQHCEGAAAALIGEVRVVNPPPPPALTLTIVLNSDGDVDRLSGAARLSGTITCSVQTAVSVFGLLRQRANRFSLAAGDMSATIPCSTTPMRWTIDVPPDGSVPFGSGMASVDMTFNAFDPNYGLFVTDTLAAAVRLKHARN